MLPDEADQQRQQQVLELQAGAHNFRRPGDGRDLWTVLLGLERS
jgi:hypothetical protein